MDENANQLTAANADNNSNDGDVQNNDVSDLETLVLQQVPDAYDSIPSIMATGGEFFAGGVLIAFIVWTIGFTINSVFRLLDEWGR